MIYRPRAHFTRTVPNPSTEEVQTESSGKITVDAIQYMTQKVREFYAQLSQSNNRFNAEDFFNDILNYVKSYGRILYSEISNAIYNYCDNHGSDETDKMIGTLNSNLEAVLRYTDSTIFQERLSKADQENYKTLLYTRKTIFKIWDHVNLAQQQYSVLKQSDDEYKRKFNLSITPFKETLLKDMSAQLITMVGIFTAISFLVFGSISSLDNVFDNTDIPLFRTIIIGAVWGLGVLNLIFVFLFCVSKMTKLSLKSNNDVNASIFQKYPVVWWCNLTLFIIIIVSLWAYYITKEGMFIWFSNLCNEHPAIATIVSLLFLLVVLGYICFILWKATKYTYRNDD